MTDAPTTPDPIEIAMEAEAARRPPGGIAAEFLAEQKRLARWQIANERAAFTLRVLTGIVGLAAAIVLGAMVWTASRSATLVVDPFSVPPELAAKGVTGQVVANRILDGMTAIQAKIDSQRSPSTFARAWDGGIQVEIPSTGVTLGELMRELRGWLGHDRHLSGEVTRTATGLALTVRLGGAPAVTFEGPEADLPTLLTRASEGAYATAEPYRWANHLRSQGRFAEAEPLFRELLVRGAPIDRPWAMLGLGNVARDVRGERTAAPYFMAAARLDPGLLLPPNNLGYGLAATGQPEAGRAWLRIAMRNVGPHSGVRPDMLEAAHLRTKGFLALVEADLLTAKAAQTRGIAFGPQGANYSMAGRLAWTHVALHDLSSARATLAAPDPSQTRHVGTIYFDRQLAELRIASAAEDWAEAARLSDYSALVASSPGLVDVIANLVEPLAAYAMARQGDLAGAQARIGRTPLDAYDAVIMRGKIAELAGNRAHADHWFGQAVKMAPSIVFAHQAWAEAKLARGDLDGAMTEARTGAKLAPRFADPLELQGEVLLARGDARGAATAFAKASRFAPRWGRLRLKWGEALARQGRTEEARAQWRAAAAIDLTAAERTALSAKGV